MGSEIRLAVGNLEVDWGKNLNFRDHCPLFQTSDFSEGEYFYIDGRGQRVSETRPVLRKPLRYVLPRLELLGYTLPSVAEEYEELRKEYERLEEPFHKVPEVSANTVIAALNGVDLNALPSEYSSDYFFGEFFREEILARVDFKQFLRSRAEESFFSEIMENFHPWAVLRMLGEKPANLDLSVTWYFADVVEEGWVDSRQFVPELPRRRSFLLVTEGSTDAKVLRKAFDLLRPEIADFFYFVDMEEGYPFTGTGNLANFCKGLVSIGILNNTLIIFDNDAEGHYKANQLLSLKRPPNMRVMRLPDLPEFESFETLGPNGTSHENINGRAASIETYLDLRWKNSSTATVRWSAYNEKTNCYQGVFIDKEKYLRSFLDLRTMEPRYDFRKVQAILDEIICHCTCIATATRLEFDN